MAPALNALVSPCLSTPPFLSDRMQLLRRPGGEPVVVGQTLHVIEYLIILSFTKRQESFYSLIKRFDLKIELSDSLGIVGQDWRGDDDT